MKKLFLLVLTTSFALKTHAQTLSLELGYGKHDYNMLGLNLYIESYQNSSRFTTESIQLGDNFHAGFKYKPHGAFELGLIGNYQHGYSKGGYKLAFGNEAGKYDQEIDAQSFAFSISNTWYISHLFKLHEKGNFLERFHFGIDYSVGVAFFNLKENRVSPESDYNGSQVFTSAKKFQGQAALKLQYDYINQPLIAAVGLKGGYQFLKSNVLHDKSGAPWSEDMKNYMILDFSGWFVTAFLTIGK